MKNKKFISSVVVFIILFISSVSVLAAMPVDGKTFEDINRPVGAENMEILDADGGNKISQSTLVLDTSDGQKDYVASYGQLYLIDPEGSPNQPQFILVDEKWVKVARVKEFGPSNCPTPEKKIAVKKPVTPKPAPTECDPLVVNECVDKGFDKTYRSNPDVYHISVKKVPEVKILNGDYKGATYARDVIHPSEYRKLLQKAKSKGQGRSDDFRTVNE